MKSRIWKYIPLTHDEKLEDHALHSLAAEIPFVGDRAFVLNGFSQAFASSELERAFIQYESIQHHLFRRRIVFILALVMLGLIIAIRLIRRDLILQIVAAIVQLLISAIIFVILTYRGGSFVPKEPFWAFPGLALAMQVTSLLSWLGPDASSGLVDYRVGLQTLINGLIFPLGLRLRFTQSLPIILLDVTWVAAFAATNRPQLPLTFWAFFVLFLPLCAICCLIVRQREKTLRDLFIVDMLQRQEFVRLSHLLRQLLPPQVDVDVVLRRETFAFRADPVMAIVMRQPPPLLLAP